MMFVTGGAGLVRREELQCQDSRSTGDLAVWVRTWLCRGADERKRVLQLLCDSRRDSPYAVVELGGLRNAGQGCQVTEFPLGSCTGTVPAQGSYSWRWKVPSVSIMEMTGGKGMGCETWTKQRAKLSLENRVFCSRSACVEYLIFWAGEAEFASDSLYVHIKHLTVSKTRQQKSSSSKYGIRQCENC